MHLHGLWIGHFSLSESKKSSLGAIIPQAVSRMPPAIPLSASVLRLSARGAQLFCCCSHAPRAATRFISAECMLRPTPAYSSDLTVPSSLFDSFRRIFCSLKPSYPLNYSFLCSIFPSIYLFFPIVPSRIFVFPAIARSTFAI